MKSRVKKWSDCVTNDMHYGKMRNERMRNAICMESSYSEKTWIFILYTISHVNEKGMLGRTVGTGFNPDFRSLEGSNNTSINTAYRGKSQLIARIVISNIQSQMTKSFHNLPRKNTTLCQCAQHSAVHTGGQTWEPRSSKHVAKATVPTEAALACAPIPTILLSPENSRMRDDRAHILQLWRSHVP